MTRKVQHYVEYFEPGVLADEVSSTEIPLRSLKSIKLPKHAFAFRFYDLTIEEAEKGPKLVSQPMNISPMYFIKGTIYTLAQAKEGIPDDKHGTILKNMLSHHYERCIVIGPEVAREFLEGDVLIA